MNAEKVLTAGIFFVVLLMSVAMRPSMVPRPNIVRVKMASVAISVPQRGIASEAAEAQHH